MVQAEAQRPSIITAWPEARSASYLSRYRPIWPPRSFAIRTAAWLAPTPVNKSAAVSSTDRPFIICHPELECDADVVWNVLKWQPRYPAKRADFWRRTAAP